MSLPSAFQEAQAELEPVTGFAGGAKQRAMEEQEAKGLQKFQLSSRYGLAGYANCLPGLCCVMCSGDDLSVCTDSILPVFLLGRLATWAG